MKTYFFGIMCSDEPYTIKQKHTIKMFVLNVGNRRTAPRVFLNISAVFTSSFISQFTSHLSLQRPLLLTPFLTLSFLLSRVFLFTLYLRDLHLLATFSRHQKLNHTLSTCKERRRRENSSPLSLGFSLL